MPPVAMKAKPWLVVAVLLVSKIASAQPSIVLINADDLGYDPLELQDRLRDQPERAAMLVDRAVAIANDIHNDPLRPERETDGPSDVDQ